jgi:hypothetical protein
MYIWYNTFANTPAIETLGTTNVETGSKFWKHRSEHTLREDVHKLGGHRYVQDADITDGNAFPDEVEVDLDMLCMLVLNGVGGELDGADVVAVGESVLWQWSMELLDELPKSTSFSHIVGHGMILCLAVWSRDDVLALWGPGVEVVTEEHSVARVGPACIRASHPVRIRIDH